MTMANNLFAQNHYHHAYGPSACAPMAIVEEDKVSKECSRKGVPSSSLTLASRDSVDSMVSWASSASTDSDSVLSQSQGGASAASRRRIFSTYWQKNPTQDEDDDEEDDQPRSPLVEHYPRKSSSKSLVQEPSGSVSPTSTIPQPGEALQEKSLQEPQPPPPLRRRSIFGAAAARHRARSSSYNGSARSASSASLDRFFSKHEHMTVLSASTLEPIHTGDYETTNHTGMANLRLRRKQRSRSYSCSDASVESAASSTSSSQSKKVPLPSCLKRRHSYTNNNSDNDLEASLNASCSTLTALNEDEELQDGDAQVEAQASPVRRPSVTFDSQIEILAFEPLKSYEMESTWTDGSWTDLFGR